jgi:hypothetical protein
MTNHAPQPHDDPPRDLPRPDAGPDGQPPPPQTADEDDQEPSPQDAVPLDWATD